MVGPALAQTTRGLVDHAGSNTEPANAVRGPLHVGASLFVEHALVGHDSFSLARPRCQTAGLARLRRDDRFDCSCCSIAWSLVFLGDARGRFFSGKAIPLGRLLGGVLGGGWDIGRGLHGAASALFGGSLAAGLERHRSAPNPEHDGRGTARRLWQLVPATVDGRIAELAPIVQAPRASMEQTAGLLAGGARLGAWLRIATILG